MGTVQTARQHEDLKKKKVKIISYRFFPVFSSYERLMETPWAEPAGWSDGALP